LFKNQDPGKGYVKSLFKETSQLATDKPRIMISPIGNPRFGTGASLWMLLISDLILLVSLALPYVITWLLTRFDPPSNETDRRHGAVFMLWLVFGQLSPLPSRITWGFIQSLPVGRLKLIMWYALVIICSTIFSSPALLGYYLVAQKVYRDSDGGQSRRALKIHEPSLT
jgi:hypothetical protein